MLIANIQGWKNVNAPFFVFKTIFVFTVLINFGYLATAKVVTAPTIKLTTSEAAIPIVGLGTSKATGNELETALESAIDAGYRHIDTATFYRNEHKIGTVLKRLIDSGKVNRSDLFITTKLPAIANRKSDVKIYFKKSLENLQLDYIDLYLVHWPFTFVADTDVLPKDSDGHLKLDHNTNHHEVWQEMESLVDNNLTRAIGLSNFNQSQITKILAYARVPPAVLQIESHLYLQQEDMLKFCKNNNLIMTAYSPLGSGRSFSNLGYKPLFELPEVQELAKKYKKSLAQIMLRYNVQRGVVVIPKSVTLSRIQENIDIFDFGLTENEMNIIKGLNKGESGRIIVYEDAKSHPEYPFKRDNT